MSRVKAVLSVAITLFILSACSGLGRPRESTWHLVLEINGKVPDKEAAIKQTAAVIHIRLNELGMSLAKVTTEGEGLRVSLPAVPDRERVKRIITDDGRLELAAVMSALNPAPVQTFATREEAIAFLGKDGTALGRVLPYPIADQHSQTKWVVVESPPIVEGNELRTANAFAVGNERYHIAFSLKPSGAEKFGAWTSKHINHYLAVVFDDEVKSVAYIKSQINDVGDISGNFSKQSAEDLALILRSGALPAKVRIIAEGDN